MTIGSLPPTVASPDCLLPLACKGRQDAIVHARAGRDTAERAAQAFADYAAPSDVITHDLVQPEAASAAACTALGKAARIAATAVREIAFTPPAAYAVKTVVEAGNFTARDFARLAMSPLTYVGMKAGDRIADAILKAKG
ncbi:hypothetical protein [Bordetella bronchialis]|uniref:Uncharacterized protein n=1 Tax=Bordetella bronchialis TaxID=463025 RepID=A0A193FUS4_9BORD|nr:hypothetical protein [Bordetella bronchialis]ANN66310.1 hypothetical protein BAU06_08425 [Bordetella bronchialis]ANN71390.1 hypothetical protein BAU08_08650 [Bordetella bronchialis]